MKFSKVYTRKKKEEFYKLIAEALTTLEKPEFRNLIHDAIVDKFIEFIKKLTNEEITKLKVLPKSYFLQKFDEFYKNINFILINKFKILLTDCWTNTYNLGIKHQIQDMLYITGLFKTFDKQPARQFSSLISPSLTTHFGLEKDTAKFADSNVGDDSKDLDDVINRPRFVIGRAKRNLTILRRNLDKLIAEEDIFNRDKLLGSDTKVSRYTLKQRIEFLRAIKEISDFAKKAEASRKTFLGEKYLEQRIRVLSSDYASRYDSLIKEELAAYVNKNIEGVRQIKTNPSKITKLRQQITKHLITAAKTDGSGKYENLIAKARTILRTELAIAYNFGKLAGFTSPLDETRKVRWNADWELEYSSNDYEVCTACAQMDGRVFTVRELLILGMNLDKGILAYGKSGGSPTDFKNPALPMIPFHPNCVPAGVSVLGYNNKVNIEDIRVGDKVYVPTSARYESVTKTHKNWYKGLLYKVKFSNGAECTYTENHPIWTSKGWVIAKELRVEDTAFTYSEEVYIHSQSVSTNVPATLKTRLQLIMQSINGLQTRLLQTNNKANNQTNHSNNNSNNQNFQGLVPVQVIKIETYVKPQYVYNLTVNNAEVYFANGILTHNCSCYWTIEPLEREEEIIQAYEEIIPTQAIPNQEKWQRYLDKTLSQKQLEKQVIETIPYPSTQENLLPTLVGVGLLVGGAFLMSRSNIWKAFFRALQTVDQVMPELVTETRSDSDIVEDVTRVGKIIKIEIKNLQLFDEFEDVLVNTIATKSVSSSVT